MRTWMLIVWLSSTAHLQVFEPSQPFRTFEACAKAANDWKKSTNRHGVSFPVLAGDAICMEVTE